MNIFWREYLTGEQRGQPGCVAGRSAVFGQPVRPMPRDFCHGLPVSRQPTSVEP